jgi:hypothetical protein
MTTNENSTAPAATWKRTTSTDGSTVYTASTGYGVTGRTLGNRGRRFTTYAPDGTHLPTGSFATLREAKAYADTHATNVQAGTAVPAAPTTPGLTTVTHADGTVSTRKSKTRVYTHAIEASPAPADRYAAHLIQQAGAQEVKALNLRTAAAVGKGHIKDRGLGGRTAEGHHSHCATLDGTDIYTWCGADQLTEDFSGPYVAGATRPLVPVLPYLIGLARESADRADRRAAELRAEAAAVLTAAVPVGEYLVPRWSSRADLAHAALSEFAGYYTAQGCTVRVVPVD